jgi:hypothetical protein
MSKPASVRSHSHWHQTGDAAAAAASGSVRRITRHAPHEGFKYLHRTWLRILHLVLLSGGIVQSNFHFKLRARLSHHVLLPMMRQRVQHISRLLIYYLAGEARHNAVDDGVAKGGKYSHAAANWHDFDNQTLPNNSLR